MPAAAFLAVGMAASAAAQPLRASSAIVLVAPRAEALLVGPSTLEVSVVDGAPPVSRVEFFVDGALACTAASAPFRCTWDAGSELRARTVRAVAILAGGGRDSATVRTSALDQRLESVDVRAVLVPAVVTDRDGRFARGLKAADFQILEDDRPVAISHFESEEAPLSVVLTLDLSGSMRRSLPEVREAIRGFIAALRPSDRLTLLGFTDRVYVLAEGSAEDVLRADAMSKLAAQGGTALYDAVVLAIGRGVNATGRHAVVVVSDGADMASQTPLAPVERLLRSSDAVIYPILVGDRDKTRRVRNEMTRLADASGGRVFVGGRVKEIVEALGTIRDELSNQYLLGYTPDGAWQRGERRVRVVAGGGRYRVRTRTHHEPAPAVAAASGR